VQQRSKPLLTASFRISPHNASFICGSIFIMFAASNKKYEQKELSSPAKILIFPQNFKEV
jgi:hypothetical protein